MSGKVPINPKIYHIIHKNNLKSIIETGYLFSDSEMSKHDNTLVKIGMNKIKLRRLTELKIPTYPNHFVGEFVPFYFCYRSVMLYMLHMGNHSEITYTEGQQPIIHLVCDLNKVVKWANDNDHKWVFTLSNAGSYYFEDRSSLDYLADLNWNIIQSNYWTNDREGKQAEFLIENKLPFQLIEKIGVIDNDIKQEVLHILANSEYKPDVEIEPSWYYERRG